MTVNFYIDLFISRRMLSSILSADSALISSKWKDSLIYVAQLLLNNYVGSNQYLK